jgi:antitoxin HicB
LFSATIYGIIIPEPTLPAPDDEPSGKFTVRVPRSLHRKLTEQAKREGVSLNQFVNVALAETIGTKIATTKN